MKRIATIALLAAGLAAAPAFAQSWYAGAGAGRGNLNMSGQDLTGLANASVNDTDTTYSARLGYKFSPYGAFEVGYYDLGHYQFSGTSGGIAVSGSAKAKSYGIAIVAIAPIGNAFEIYSRIGIAESELKANANAVLVTANSSERQSEATYGLGARIHFTNNLSLFGEWMKNDKIQVDSYLIGVDLRF
jgi:OOP family OmpA-OmpF porin